MDFLYIYIPSFITLKFILYIYSTFIIYILLLNLSIMNYSTILLATFFFSFKFTLNNLNPHNLNVLRYFFDKIKTYYMILFHFSVSYFWSLNKFNWKSVLWNSNTDAPELNCLYSKFLILRLLCFMISWVSVSKIREN